MKIGALPLQRFNSPLDESDVADASTNHVATALVSEIIRRRGFFG
jgi:hypothetical protein